MHVLAMHGPAMNGLARLYSRRTTCEAPVTAPGKAEEAKLGARTWMFAPAFTEPGRWVEGGL